MLKPDNVFLAVKPVDMRRGIDTLTQYVQDALKSSWHDSAAFIFANKARTRIKVLRWVQSARKCTVGNSASRNKTVQENIRIPITVTDRGVDNIKR